MNKMLINHLDKIFVTSDTATLLKELEVAHPVRSWLLMHFDAVATSKLCLLFEVQCSSVHSACALFLSAWPGCQDHGDGRADAGG
jgi:hypothetical protein